MASQKHIRFQSPESLSPKQKSHGIEESVTLGSKDSFTNTSSNETDSASDGHPALNRHPPGSGKKWSNLFQNYSKDDLKLDKFEIVDELISLDVSDLLDINKEWGLCLIGCFAGRWPGLDNIRKLTDFWNKDCTIVPHTNNCVIFRFKNQPDIDLILDGGPYHCMGQPLILKKLTDGAEFSQEELINVPVWVRYPKLPLECWHRTALGKISSKIGKPICCDRPTQQKRLNACAKVLIEVDATLPLPDYVHIKLPCGKIFEQKIAYDHTPKLCLKCTSFGHYTEKCDDLPPPINKGIGAAPFSKIPGPVQKPSRPVPKANKANSIPSRSNVGDSTLPTSPLHRSDPSSSRDIPSKLLPSVQDSIISDPAIIALGNHKNLRDLPLINNSIENATNPSPALASSPLPLQDDKELDPSSQPEDEAGFIDVQSKSAQKKEKAKKKLEAAAAQQGDISSFLPPQNKGKKTVSGPSKPSSGKKSHNHRSKK